MIGDIIIVRGERLRIVYVERVTGYGEKGPYSYVAVGTERA